MADATADPSPDKRPRERRWGVRPAVPDNQPQLPEMQPPPEAPGHPDAKGSRRGKGNAASGGAASSQARSAGFGAGRGCAVGTSNAYAAGVRSAFALRYAAELERLRARPDLPANARWFDSHCHLESILQRSWRGGGKPQVLENEPLVSLQELVAQWPSGLSGCISNFVFKRESKPGTPAEWVWLERNLHHFAPDSPVSDKLWFTIGLHPHDAGNWDAFAERTVRRFGAHPKCVGIGECGLDFFKHDQREAEQQLTAFRAQAHLAVELGKALVVHGRLTSAQNEELCMRELERIVPRHHPIHIHCYSDSLRHARELCERWPNLRIGFTGAITFRDREPGKGKDKGKKGKKGKDVTAKKGEEHCRELIQGLPLDRLLIETDGPYMCPEPFRGQTAHPGHVHRVAERIAEWKGVSLGDVMDATWQSTCVVYGVQ